MADQQYCLRWNNHQNTLISVFDSLQERGCMVDCTLGAEGQSLQAHKVVLSACSPYLEDLLTKHYDKHPILILKDVRFEELKAMVDYMYRGEVNVAHDKLNTFLRAAESLQIKGLSDSGHDPPDTGGTSSGTKRTSKGAPVSVRSSQQLTVRSTNLADESRDGSVSPSQRKRRRRRGSEESENDSSSNVADGKQSSAAVAPVTGPSVLNQDLLPSVPASGPADALLSSIMESAETETATDSGIFANAVTPSSQENVIQDKGSSDLLIEPKTEYLDDDTQDMPLGDDDSGAGPSHSRSGNFMNDSDMFMPDQDGTNAQGSADYGAPLEVPTHLLKNESDEDESDADLDYGEGEDEQEFNESQWEAADFEKESGNDSEESNEEDIDAADLGGEDSDDPIWEGSYATDMDIGTSQEEAGGASSSQGPQSSCVCSKCGMTFRSLRFWKSHTAVCCKATGKSMDKDTDTGKAEQHECTKCKLSFKTKELLLVHSKNHHKEVAPKKPAPAPAPAPTPAPTQTTHFLGSAKSENRCRFCDNTYDTMQELEVHIMKHYGYPCAKCGTQYPDFAQLQSLAEHNRHICPADLD